MSSNLIAFEGSLLECSCCAAAALAAAAGNNIARSRREYFMFILEVEFQSKLQDTRVECACNPSEGRRAQVAGIRAVVRQGRVRRDGSCRRNRPHKVRVIQ